MITFIGGYYRDSVDFIEVAAIDIERVATIGSFELDEAYVDAMRRCALGRSSAPSSFSLYGWQIGDRVTVRSPVWSKADGSQDWTFDIVGIYSIPEGAFPADGSFWVNFGYFDEERAFAKGTVSFYTLRVDDADSAAATGSRRSTRCLRTRPTRR